MKRFRTVDDVERDMRKVGAPANWLEKHMRELQAARTKRRTRRARAEADKPNIVQRDRYPNE